MATKTQAQVDATTTQAATGNVYKVQSNGSGPKGMKAGDQVVTAQGTYQVNSVRPDGSYDSKLVNRNQTTANYTGTYAAYPGTKTTAKKTTTTTAKKPATPAYARPYKSNIDWSAQVQAAAAAGDLPAAAYFEQMHNKKNTANKTTGKYANTNVYSKYLNQLTPERKAQLNNGYVRDTTMLTQNPSADLNSMIEQWYNNGTAQIENQINYNTEKGVNELQRAMEDAQPQFQQQLNQNEIDAAKAQDNSALYAQARGDNGGIGQSQYNEIQAQALKNRQTINDARVKLATDTARQIADLRSQGQFELADKVAELNNQRLTKLFSMEQWAAEFGLNQEQVLREIENDERQYQLQLAPYTGMINGQQTLQARTSEQERLAEQAQLKIQLGVMPTKEELAAMNMTQSDARTASWNSSGGAYGIGGSTFSSGGSGSGSAGSSGGKGSSSKGSGKGSGNGGGSNPTPKDNSIKIADSTGNAAAVKAINDAMQKGDSVRSVNNQILAKAKSGELTYNEAVGLINRNTGVRATTK